MANRVSWLRVTSRTMVFMTVLAAMSLIVGTAYAGHGIVSLPGSDFEIDVDANLKVDDGGDWEDWASVNDLSKSDQPSGQTDDSFGNGTKEDTAVPSVVAGSIPPNKSDLKRFGVYTEETADGKFLHMYWTRVQDPKGTTNMDFEFNQSSQLSANGVTPVRTDGDLLVVYELSKGGTVPELFLFTWFDGSGGETKAICDSSNSLPCWGDRTNLTASGAATGSINTSFIPGADSDGNGDLDPRTFGEATVDLDFVFDPNKCESFGSVYLKSRSSDSFTAALKDFIEPLQTNISNCGSVTVIKNTVPSSLDGTFSYTKTFDSDPATANNFDITTSGGTGSAVFTNVIAGTGYTIDETALPDGWTFTSLQCSSSTGQVIGIAGDVATFDVAVGEAVTCTYTNSALGKIIVDKVTDPSGDPAVFDFDASWLNGPDGIDFMLDDDDTPFDSGDLTAGTYSVTELAKDGWDLTSTVCVNGDGVDQGGSTNMTLDAGETITCTFTNQKDANIIVDKVTDPSGDPAVFDFTASYGNFSLTDAAAPNNSGDLDPGTYSVTEDALAGWDLTSVVCNSSLGGTEDNTAINLTAGETVTCTFTNQKDANIIVDKVTDPSGDPAVFNFTASYGNFSLTDAAAPNNSGDLDPGTYSVTEDALAGWDLTSVVCNSSLGGTEDNTAINLTAGETVTCTFTNQKDANIIVDKVTDPSGDPAVFNFTASYGNFSLTDAAAPNNSGDLDPGTYSVTEDALAGWDLTSVVCNSSLGGTEDNTAINLTAGETVTCTFTNQKRGRIDVLKTDDGGNVLEGVTFSLYIDNAPVAGTFNGGGEDVDTGVDCVTDAAGKCSFSNLVPGDYWVVEDAAPTGYLGADPQAVTVAAGDLDDDVELTFINVQLHKVIVLVCHMGTDELVESDVTYDGNTIVSIGTVPAHLAAKGVTEADLCGLTGFEDLEHGSIDVNVNVGSAGGAIHD